MADSYFAALCTCAAAICSAAGFQKVQPAALSLLTHRMQARIEEIGEAGKNLSEHARRTDPTLQDVLLALKKFNIDYTTLVSAPTPYSQIPELKQLPPIPVPRPLSIGVKQPQPHSVSSNLPPFPDPHTYLSTPAQPRTPPSYQEQRAKMAEQRRLGAESLVRYSARTRQLCPVLGTEPEDEALENLFFLAAEPLPHPPYLSALLSKKYIAASATSRARDTTTDSNPFLRTPKRIKLKLTL